MTYKMRVATKDDNDLLWIDHTKASAINTCPMWGMVRYVEGKTPTAEGRNLALETVCVCHEVITTARYAYLVDVNDADLDRSQCERHIGSDRYTQMYSVYTASEGSDKRTNFSLEALHSSGYYDDPRDKRRT